MKTIKEAIKSYRYLGRGIIMGVNENFSLFFIAYFLTGRSENSKNRVFVLDNEKNVNTKPFEEKYIKNKDLYIYKATAKFKNITIITNGDHTNTILHNIKTGKTFEDGVRSRNFEEDPPIFTPRIAAALKIGENKDIKYKMAIVKSFENNSCSTQRFFFEYFTPLKGTGHLIHTYKPKKEDVVASFYGEPISVFIPQSLDKFTNDIWNSLDEEYKVSLFTKSICLDTKKEEIKIINKNSK